MLRVLPKGYLDLNKDPAVILAEIQKHAGLDAVVVFGWIDGYTRDNSNGQAVVKLVRKYLQALAIIGLVNPQDKGKFTVDQKVDASDVAGQIAAILFQTL